MIDLPLDFHLTGYDLIDTTGDRWRVTDTPGETPVLSSGERYILLSRTGDGEAAPFHKGLNLFHHGFDCDGQHTVIAGVEQNENYLPLIPTPPVESDALYAKERAFVAALLQYATAFQIDIAALDPINITTMLTAAHVAGVQEADIAAATAILLALTRDIEAEADATWAKCWDGLKERFLGYVGEILNQ